jgi:hypothetical protein
MWQQRLAIPRHGASQARHWRDAVTRIGTNGFSPQIRMTRLSGGFFFAIAEKTHIRGRTDLRPDSFGLILWTMAFRILAKSIPKSVHQVRSSGRSQLACRSLGRAIGSELSA